MVAKKYGENEIRMMFSSFGQIEECRILRGPDGQSRGRCAFSVGTAAFFAFTAATEPSTYSHPVFIQGPSTPKIKCYSPPVAPIAIPIVYSSRQRYTQPPRLSAKGHCTRLSGTMARRRGNRWLLVFVGSAGRRLGSAQLLLYRLLHHTLQRQELACRRISYIALNCIKPRIAGVWICTIKSQQKPLI